MRSLVKVQSAKQAPKGKKAQQAKHAQHAQQAKENKKAQKGTTKKSRAQAEEEALLNEGIEEAKPKGKELSRGELSAEQLDGIAAGGTVPGGSDLALIRLAAATHARLQR